VALHLIAARTRSEGTRSGPDSVGCLERGRLDGAKTSDQAEAEARHPDKAADCLFRMRGTAGRRECGPLSNMRGKKRRPYRKFRLG